jgi:hypothetical protein
MPPVVFDGKDNGFGLSFGKVNGGRSAVEFGSIAGMDRTGFGGQPAGSRSWAKADAATMAHAPIAATKHLIVCRRMTSLPRGIFHLYRSSASAGCDENLASDARSACHANWLWLNTQAREHA